MEPKILTIDDMNASLKANLGPLGEQIVAPASASVSSSAFGSDSKNASG